MIQSFSNPFLSAKWLKIDPVVGLDTPYISLSIVLTVWLSSGSVIERWLVSFRTLAGLRCLVGRTQVSYCEASIANRVEVQRSCAEPSCRVSYIDKIRDMMLTRRDELEIPYRQR